MTRNPTNFQNSSGNGSALADGFTSSGRLPSVIPNLTVSGFSSSGLGGMGAPQLITAAGATQGAATAITKSFAILTVVTASARGVRLPLAVTGRTVRLFSGAVQGCKVYPGANDKIGAAATNVAVVLAGGKANVYAAQDATTWRVQVGA